MPMPWYVDIVNYLTMEFAPTNFNGNECKKLLHDSRGYCFDEPYLFKLCVDQVIRRCVDEKTTTILEECRDG